MRRARSRTPRVAARSAAFVLASLVLAGCAPQAATTEGAQIKGLYDLFLVAAAGVFVIVAGLIGWSILRYRAHDGDEGLPPQIRDNRRLELVWWALPTILVIVLFVATAGVLRQVDATSPDPALRVLVTGSQWQWRFAYEGTDVVVQGTPGQEPQLVLPIGERIAFDLESADVIHSFWVPAFLMKRDVVPGQTNHIELTIDAVGTYRGQCAEFCGRLHDQMVFSIRAVTASDFDDWLGSQEGG
jgi:cytochrome c oxidase subunit II